MRLTEEQRETANGHIEAAMASAKWHTKRHPRLRDEFFAACGVALCRAVATYEPGRSAMTSWIAMLCRQACLDVLREAHGRKGRPRPREHATDDLFDVPSGDGPVGWEAESEDATRAMLAILPPRHRTVMERTYLVGVFPSLKGAGELVGVGESMACRIHRESLRAIRAHLEMSA